MDQEVLVNLKFEGARLLINALNARSFLVDIAFWVKPRDEDKWFLYIASKSVDSVGLHGGYHLVNAILRDAPDWGIDFFDVCIVNAQNPMAEEALKQVKSLHRRDTYTLPISYRGRKLGGESIDGAYIYLPCQLANAA